MNIVYTCPRGIPPVTLAHAQSNQVINTINLVYVSFATHTRQLFNISYITVKFQFFAHIQITKIYAVILLCKSEPSSKAIRHFAIFAPLNLSTKSSKRPPIALQTCTITTSNTSNRKHLRYSKIFAQ